MYEDKTADNLHTEILSNIDDSYEKTTGFPTYDITKSFAIEGAAIYSALQLLFNKIDVDNLTGDELEKYTNQRKGITRKPSKVSSTGLTVNGNGTISIGNLFETPSGVQFKAIETKVISGTGIVNIEAVTAGAIGNVPANTITQMPITIAGITSITNGSTITNGYDAENDDDLRDRYYEALQNPSTGLNKNQYIKWAKEVTGVGDALCYSTWNGNTTVKVVIVDSNKEPASAELVNTTQDYIDPKGDYDSGTDTWSLWGTGEGVAPMGAHCTVESASGKEITIKVVIIKTSSNYTDDEIISNIKSNIKSYFKEIAFDKNNAYVSYAKIGNFVLNSEGVSDHSNLTINDSTSNINLSLTPILTEVPIIKDVMLL